MAVFLVASSIMPLWWASFSETAGRRAVMIVSLALNVPLTLACGFSPNAGFLIAFRLLAGSCSASAQSVGAGVITDIWPPEKRALAMSVFYLGPLVGPLFLPLVGGALTQAFGWRSIMWFLTAHGALVLALIVVALPETLTVRIVSSQPARSHIASTTEKQPPSGELCESGNPVARPAPGKALLIQLAQPFKSVSMLRNPLLAIAVLTASVAFGSCYVLNISVQSAFSSSPYAYSSTTVGLLFLPNSFGCILTAVVGGRWVDSIMIRKAQTANRMDDLGNLEYLPEDRLGLNAWVSLALYPAALILYGWTVQSGLHWMAPSVGGFLFGAGVMLIFTATTTMAAEFVPGNSTGGVALNNLVRNVFSCVGTVIAQPLIDRMGHGWLFTLCGLLAWLSGYAGVFLIKRYGKDWRAQAKI